MPLDLNCPKCEFVFAVTEARHPVGVQCPGCEAELTAEFRRVPVPEPGEHPYELVVSVGSPAGSVAPAAGKKPLPLDDDGDRRGGGSMVMVVMVAMTALVIMLGGLGVTGYYLFTHMDPPETSSSSSGGGFTSGGGGKTKGNVPKGGGNPTPGPGWPGGNPGGGNTVPPPKKKATRFELNPVNAPLPPIPQTNIPAVGQTVVLPGVVGTASVGGGGRYIVMHFPQQNRLTVFDTSTGELVKSTPVDPGDAQVAAGANRVLVYAGGKFHAYSLPDLNKIFEDKSPMFFPLHGIAMGSRANGPLLMVDPFGEVVLADVSGSGVTEIDATRGKPGIHANMPKASADGKMFTSTGGFGSDGKTVILTEWGGQWKTVSAEVHGGGYPSPDGRYVFGNDAVADGRTGFAILSKKPAAGGTRSWYVPATSGSYYVKLTEVKKGNAPGQQALAVSIHTNPRAEKVVLQNLGETAEAQGLVDWFGGNSVPLDRHVFLIPEAKLLATLTSSKDKLVLRKVEIR
jgi:hypothetical protein